MRCRSLRWVTASHQPTGGFPSQHVRSELSKSRGSNPSQPHGVRPAPCPQDTCASWQDTHTPLLCPSPGPACPFPGHQPCEIPRMTILLLRDMGQLKLVTQKLCKRLTEKKYPLFPSSLALTRRHCHADRPDAACHPCLAFLPTPNSWVLFGASSSLSQGCLPSALLWPYVPPLRDILFPSVPRSSDTFLGISFALLQHKPAAPSEISGFFAIGKITGDWNFLNPARFALG